VHERVRVRMAVETFRVRNFHAAEHEFAPGDELMNVITNANMNHGQMLERAPPPTKIFHAAFTV